MTAENPMKRTPRSAVPLFLTALAAASLAAGCEYGGFGLPGAVDPHNDFSDETFDQPANDGEGVEAPAEPGEAPVDAPVDPGELPVEAPPAPEAPVGIVGPHWPGPCVVSFVPVAEDDTRSLGHHEFAYDEEGRTTDEWLDEDGDNEPETHVLYDRDALGRPHTISWDAAFDGRIDALRFFAFEEGKRIRVLDDLDNDGLFDAATTTSLDAGGRPELTEIDGDNDGEPEVRQFLTFDDLGRLSVQADFDLRTTDQATVHRYTYDPTEGFLQSIDTDVGDDGRLEEQRLFTWTAQGYAATEEHQVFVYAAGGEEAFTAEKISWRRDADGNPIESVHELPEGQVSRRAFYDYTCWR
jgi:hypothetical protein